MYDIYHQQIMEGNIFPNITQNLDCIAHLHSAGHPGRHELQYGVSDYRVIFDAVDKAGYTGACGLEYGPLLDPEESLRIARDLYGPKMLISRNFSFLTRRVLKLTVSSRKKPFFFIIRVYNMHCKKKKRSFYRIEKMKRSRNDPKKGNVFYV